MRPQLRRRQLMHYGAMASLLMVVGVVGVFMLTFTREPASTTAELAHRGWRYHVHHQTNWPAEDTTDGDASQGLHVSPIIDATPTATPSDSSDSYSTLDMTPVPTPPAVVPDSKSTQTTVAQDAPNPLPAPAPVTVTEQTPTPTPVVTTTNPVTLPAITIPASTSTTADLTNPAKKEIAMELVSSAENSSLDWKAQYAYLEDIGDGRGYTGGIIGFTSGTHDMLELVQYYTKLKPNNPLASFVTALQKVDGTDSHAGLGSAFETAWKSAATDTTFQKAQNDERDRVYFNPAVAQAKKDGLRALGQFIYYDAMVMHGPGNDAESFGGIRAAALKKAKTPAQGGDETAYLNAFLDARVTAMKAEAAHDDISRVEDEQRVFLKAGNLNLNTPLRWQTYGDPYVLQ